MKLIIAGSRDLLVDSDFIEAAVKFFRLDVTEVVSGNSGNVDEAGEEWSLFFLEKEAKSFPANWRQEGVGAGPIRNNKMAEYGEALLLIWDGTSKGSLNMRMNMLNRSKPVYEIVLRSHT
jgi:hypothetical protein